MSETQNFVIVVAAGSGLRMGSKTKKQYLCLDKQPILARTLKAFDQQDDIKKIVLVIPKEDHDYCRLQILDPYDFNKEILLVAGGKHRQDSVFNGLKKIRDLFKPTMDDVVLIHDGVRPFVPQDLIKTCITAAQKEGACVPAIEMTDTVKQADAERRIQKTIPRDNLFCAQTPQAFKMGVIWDAFESARKTQFLGTDDASLVEKAGGKVVVVKGAKKNIKITTPEDFAMGTFFLTQQI